MDFEEIIRDVKENFIKSIEQVEKDVAKQLMKVDILKD